jgi:hypothetical protein
LILGFIWEVALLWRRRAIGVSKKIIAGGGGSWTFGHGRFRKNNSFLEWDEEVRNLELIYSFNFFDYISTQN